MLLSKQHSAQRQGTLRSTLVSPSSAVGAHHVEVVAEELDPAALVLLCGLPAVVPRHPHVQHRLRRCLATLRPINTTTSRRPSTT